MLAERYQDVLSARRRRSLARSLEGIVRSLDPRLLPGASPLNRPGLWVYVPEIRTLAARVGDLDRPASRRASRDSQTHPRRAGRPLMWDLGAILIVLGCFGVVFGLLYTLDQV